MKQFLKSIALIILLLTICCCEPKPQPINYGQDGCAYCRMTIVEEYYGTEIVSKTGKTYKFDSIECLVAYLYKDTIDDTKVHQVYATDFEDAGNLHPLDDLVFVYARKLSSPMGLNLSAYRSPATADNVAELYFGERMTWEQVQQYVVQSWF